MNTDTVPEFHAEAPWGTISRGLVQGPYVAARAGVEPMTLRTKGVYFTKVPPRPMANVVIVKLVDCMLDLDRYGNGLPVISLTTNKTDMYSLWHDTWIVEVF